jgi:hypothetical protein
MGATHYLRNISTLQYFHFKSYLKLSIDYQAIFSYKLSMRHLQHTIQWDTITSTRRGHDTFRRILHALHCSVYQQSAIVPVHETHIMMWQGDRLVFEAHVYDLVEEE